MGRNSHFIQTSSDWVVLLMQQTGYYLSLLRNQHRDFIGTGCCFCSVPAWDRPAAFLWLLLCILVTYLHWILPHWNSDSPWLCNTRKVFVLMRCFYSSSDL